MDSSTTRLSVQRVNLLRQLFPGGVPTLWCPLLTHFTRGGAIDATRMRAHLKFMLPSVKGFLVPGSTGEGWEMADDDVRELLAVVIDTIANQSAHLLIGVLKTSTEETRHTILQTMSWLGQRAPAVDAIERLKRASVCGFTICPPSGGELTQAQIVQGLEAALSLGYPVALYQLPQVTQNEMSPLTVTALAAQFANFYLLKDTSGSDRVAQSGFREALLLRGAEGDYANHLVSASGTYDGFLLSTANSFGKQLKIMIKDVEDGNLEEAETFSKRLTALSSEVFHASAQVGYGNAFTNANKALDHFFAFGPSADRVTPPRLYSGRSLPAELIATVGDSLRRFGLMPTMGYL